MKRMCPHCHELTIPRLHAWRVMAWNPTITCSNCGTRLKLVFGRDYGLPTLACAIPAFANIFFDVHPMSAVYFFLVFGGLFSLCLQELFIRYVEVAPPGPPAEVRAPG